MKTDWTLRSCLDYRFIAELEFEVYGRCFEHDGAPFLETGNGVKLTASVSLERKTPGSSGLVPASAADYARWLRGYVKRGGKITHRYDYPFKRAGFLHATEDVTVNSRKEFGARSRDIIAAPGVKVTRSVPGPQEGFNGWGHTKVYWMNGYRTNNTGIVPVYSDPEFDEFRKAGKR
jgi:hypothetical protein